MNYKITKKTPDGRCLTCGLWIPDGFTIVRELTHDRISQMQLLKKFGYLVEETDMAEGAFDDRGHEVEYASIEKSYTEGRRIVLVESDVTSKSSETVPVKEDRALEDDIRMMQAELDARGIKYRKDAGVDALRKKLA